ncbi:MAG: NACHT domain-containing protein, partial [Chloroflexi bacterium]|nr:NACHT domain-containing protein [Chloroflexota bacterium]
TFSRWLALRAAKAGREAEKLPVYAALRRFNTWEGDLLGLLAQELRAVGIADAESKLKLLLQQGKLLFLLDGLDEVQAALRPKLIDQIDDLSKMSAACQIVITCRPYAEARRFEQFVYVKMADFTAAQVQDFISSWFFEDKAVGSSLLHDLRQDDHKSIRELTQTPLLLALLCIAYQEKGEFPQKRDELYARALNVVLTQWDDERGVKRDSAYGLLTTGKKQALAGLACL